MSLIVQKFGGTSVADAQKIKNAAKIISDTYKKGNRVIAVVSAQGDTTDRLIEMAGQINQNASKREFDVLMSTGEQISIALLAMALEQEGVPAVSLNGRQAGIYTDSEYSSAHIKNIDKTRIERELDSGRVAVVAGFQGIDMSGDITTLGRGGSDTTAVALAAAFDAELCQIFTDVDGVYTADPRIAPNAKKLDAVSYDEMLELATQGAQVLHNRSVEMAKRYNVKMEVLSSFSNNPGTIMTTENMEKPIVSGVAKNDDAALICLNGLENKTGVVYGIFSELAKNKINVDMIMQSAPDGQKQDISITVKQSLLGDVEAILEKIKESVPFDGYSVNDRVSKISAVGAGMANNHGVAADMFEALQSSDIKIFAISSSEITISVLVEQDLADKALRAVHDKFFA